MMKTILRVNERDKEEKGRKATAAVPRKNEQDNVIQNLGVKKGFFLHTFLIRKYYYIVTFNIMMFVVISGNSQKKLFCQFVT